MCKTNSSKCKKKTPYFDKIWSKEYELSMFNEMWPGESPDQYILQTLRPMCKNFLLIHYSRTCEI